MENNTNTIFLNNVKLGMKDLTESLSIKLSNIDSNLSLDEKIKNILANKRRIPGKKTKTFDIFDPNTMRQGLYVLSSFYEIESNPSLSEDQKVDKMIDVCVKHDIYLDNILNLLGNKYSYNVKLISIMQLLGLKLNSSTKISKLTNTIVSSKLEKRPELYKSIGYLISNAYENKMITSQEYCQIIKDIYNNTMQTDLSSDSKKISSMITFLKKNLEHLQAEIENKKNQKIDKDTQNIFKTINECTTKLVNFQQDKDISEPLKKNNQTFLKSIKTMYVKKIISDAGRKFMNKKYGEFQAKNTDKKKKFDIFSLFPNQPIINDATETLIASIERQNASSSENDKIDLFDMTDENIHRYHAGCQRLFTILNIDSEPTKGVSGIRHTASELNPLFHLEYPIQDCKDISEAEKILENMSRNCFIADTSRHNNKLPLKSTPFWEDVYAKAIETKQEEIKKQKLRKVIDDIKYKKIRLDENRYMSLPSNSMDTNNMQDLYDYKHKKISKKNVSDADKDLTKDERLKEFQDLIKKPNVNSELLIGKRKR